MVVSLTVMNDGPMPIAVPRDLSPEAGGAHIYLERPDGQVVEHRPPTYRLVAPEDVVMLAPGESYATPIQLSFPATGPEFVNPGQYRVRALLTPDGEAMLPSNDLRLRVASPTSRAMEELTELVTRPEVAKFLYFRGSAAHPELADGLTEAAERFEQASPATVAHLRAALGRHAGRDVKVVGLHRGARTVSQRRGDPEAAAHHLELGMALGAEHHTLPAVELERLAAQLTVARAAAGDGGRRRAKAPKKSGARKR